MFHGEKAMVTRLYRQITSKVFDYLDGKITLDDMDSWLVSRTWNLDPEAEPSTNDLALTIQLRLAEYSNGHLTKQQLNSHLSELLGTLEIRLASNEPRILTVSTTATFSPFVQSVSSLRTRPGADIWSRPYPSGRQLPRQSQVAETQGEYSLAM